MSIGVLVSHGSAPYKDEPNNSKSYFVELESEGQKHKIWGVDLENAMEKTAAKVGDMVTVNNLGSKTLEIPDPADPSKSKSVKRNEWEVETYEPYQNLNNAIEHDEERELQKTQSVEKTKENDEPVKLQKPKLAEFEENLPDSVKNNYVAIPKNRFLQDEKINYYDKSDPDKVNIAFEDRKTGLHTSRQDEKTVKAMMDLAEIKGWTAIKLKGTEEFKQKAWLEASLRGIETKGYEPTEKDKAELIAKQEARTINQVEATSIKEALPKQIKVTQSTQEDKEKSLIQPKEIATEIAIPAVTPTPLQPVVATAFLAKDVKDIAEYTNEKIQDIGKEVKAQIREITQNGYKAGTITNRNDLVNVLTDHGYEVVKENEKSIRLKIPNSDQHLTLKGEMFTKDYDALKQIKASLEPETIKERYPQISDTGIAQITAWKNHMLEKYETPQAQQHMLNRLEISVTDVAKGKDLGLPPIPANEIKPDINVEIRTGDKSRSR